MAPVHFIIKGCAYFIFIFLVKKTPSMVHYTQRPYRNLLYVFSLLKGTMWKLGFLFLEQVNNETLQAHYITSM